jgi:hypothetical protein
MGTYWNTFEAQYARFWLRNAFQTGWYLNMLATEYKLLSSNGQTESAQKTLEEIFSALQAVNFTLLN